MNVSITIHIPLNIDTEIFSDSRDFLDISTGSEFERFGSVTIKTFFAKYIWRKSSSV